MNMAKIVIALGGNALGNNPIEQKELVKLPAKMIANLVQEGHRVVIGHGNGPQVGMIFNAFGDAKKANEKTPLIPFAEAGGMSQGYIGYHLLTALSNAFNFQKINQEIIYVLTQTIVDKNDPAFKNPTKPVGPFYATKTDAQKNNPNSLIVEDAGRGYRKVVPSPLPINFLGINAIKANVDNGVVVIVGGGGGIPTIIENDQYIGVDGVIDKDFALATIADKIDADVFLILTAVDHVFINFSQPNQKALHEVNVNDLEKYINEKQFAPGSMLPKIQAAKTFVKNHANRYAIIASLSKVNEALAGKSGTKIIN